ncbi:MAG: RNA polymerase sporulation sigma factor SigK [Lachnospiraceae bacterium]|nr:RNA polymerase sporulation sigma factor SigK [Lachnospiraceae bacterium]
MITFKQPLSEEEEAYYIRMYFEGEKEASEKARQILIERNLRLVAHVAKKYQNVDESPEDLISIGTIGLIKAIQTYDGNKGNRLATYAARCIDNELLMMLRAKKKSSKDVSIYEPVGIDKEGNEISLLDITCAEDTDAFEKMSRQDDIKKLRAILVETLTPKELQVIRLRYALDGEEEMPQRKIGQILGISRSYVSRIEKKALRKLRARFEEDTTM